MSIETRRTTLAPIFAEAARPALKIILWLSCFTFLGGCGIKGPLYLPPEKATTTESGSAETAPTPAPESTTK